MLQTRSWNAANVISKKFAVGTVTTATHAEKTAYFDEMNTRLEDKSSIYPQAQYFGENTDEKVDKYNNRKVKALNDISFEEDEDWEEIKNLKRMNKTILNSENLR